MYTRCPDCSTAFLVTADVLKQAAGKVRCGGCGNAFNALEYLSEKMPEQPATDRDSPAPELTAELRDNDDGPITISAEQNAALMKTLDELEGPDIRIEDTGVEWRVLDETDESDSAEDDALEDSSASIEELRFDDDTPLPDDFNLGEESSDEADVTDIEEHAAEGTPDTDIDSEPAEDSFGEPDEWADILDEVDESVTSTEASDSGIVAAGQADEPPDVDTQFALQAVEMGIDLSGMQQTLSEADEEPTRRHSFEEQQEEVVADDVDEAEQEDQREAPLEFGSLDAELSELEEQSDVNDEEQDLNQMIDRELLDLAVEDDDGFASTIIIADDAAEPDVVTAQAAKPVEENRSPGFESIVMEGDFVRSAIYDEKHEADVAAAAILAGTAHDDKDETYVPDLRSRHRGLIAAVIGLSMLLLLQSAHHWREQLAMIPAFNKVASPMYRMIGMPLSPAWDVSGWRFEARFDELEVDADTGEEQLNIFPRIGNKSDRALPYPLVSVSLTDRFEEIIAGRVLEPAEYLPDDRDPRQLVQPGNSFDAVISIQSPAKEAAGYKLKVCYRLSNGQLRCNVPVFK